MAEQTIPLGTPSNRFGTAFMNWVLFYPLDGDFFEDGQGATLRSVAFRPNQIQIRVTRGPLSTDLIEDWETQEEAVTMIAGMLRQVFPGPAAPSITNKDTTNPYGWSTGLEFAFLRAYDALSDMDRANTSMILKSSEPIFYRKKDKTTNEKIQHIWRKNKQRISEPIRKIWRKMSANVYELIFQDLRVIHSNAIDILDLSGSKFVLDDPIYSVSDILNISGGRFFLDDNEFIATDILKLSGSQFKLPPPISVNAVDILNLSGSRFVFDRIYNAVDILNFKGTKFDLPPLTKAPPKIPENFQAHLVTMKAEAPGPPVITAIVSGNVITAYWRAGEGGTPTNYGIQQHRDSTFPSSGLSSLSRSTQGSQRYAGLANGTYYFRARASNSHGTSAWSPTISVVVNEGVTVTKPESVYSLTLSAVRRGGAVLVQADLRVSVGNAERVESFEFQRYVNENLSGSFITYTRATPADFISSVPFVTFLHQTGSGTGNFYRARAVNSAGAGPWTDVVWFN